MFNLTQFNANVPCSNHIETSPVTCTACQFTGFFMIGTVTFNRLTEKIVLMELSINLRESSSRETHISDQPKSPTKKCVFPKL